jgi:hypothetical protein
MRSLELKENNMIVNNFRSNPKQTPFAPEWNYHMFEKIINDVDFKDVENYLLNKEQEILKINPTEKDGKVSDGYTGLGAKSTTARYDKYNVLKWDNKNIQKIKDNIVEFHNEILNYLKLPPVKELYVQCWVNIMRNNEVIKPHIHTVQPDCYLGGHICVKTNNTSTHYINPINQINDPVVFSSKNEIGKMTLFNNNIPHYTDKVKDERITIAFDLATNQVNNELRII